MLCVCSVSLSYDIPFDEKPLLEDKIVSILGCMVSLVNNGREDVISGRFSVMSPFRAAGISSIEETLPPLAVFRNEMKRCCESLHIALEKYLIPGDNRSLNVWRKLQRLKNVCYDSGFPRKDDYPCPALFANFRPVYLSTSKEDSESKASEADFWIGGQVTEEGLKWLLDRGYKTIVDLRKETVKDNFYHDAVHDAISSGAIELVKIPIEVSNAPTKEQVEKFASLVSDSSKRPIYLHSKEGVWRTSAMVSRWREYTAHSAPQYVSNQAVISSDMLTEKDTDLLQSTSPKENNEKTQSNRTLSGIITNDGVSSQAINANGEESFPSFSSKTSPLETQVPPHDVFSKNKMSRFFGSKKISKPSYSNWSAHVDYPSGKTHITVGNKSKVANVNTSSSIRTTVNGFSERELHCMTNVNDVDNAASNSQRIGGDEDKEAENLGFFEGDVCIFNGSRKVAIKKESRDVPSTNRWIFLCERKGD